MVEMFYLGGLVAVTLGIVLYLYRRWEQSQRHHSNFRCVHHVTASGEPISFLLAPRDTTESSTEKVYVSTPKDGSEADSQRHEPKERRMPSTTTSKPEHHFGSIEIDYLTRVEAAMQYPVHPSTVECG